MINAGEPPVSAAAPVAVRWNRRPPVEMKKAKRLLLIAAGTLCVALGVVGMFLPVLPTTPFLLLAAVCYARSSKRFYGWLTTNRWCGEYIRNYREGRGIPRQQKALTILLLWVTIGSTAGFAVSLWWVKLILLGIAVAVTIHLLRIKTFKPEPQDSPLPGESGTPADSELVEEPGNQGKVIA
jgi:uncharacterized protein